jgi:hypothetical protein
LEGSRCDVIEVLSLNFLGGTEGNQEKLQIRIACVPAGIRTKYQQNFSPEPYRSTTPLGQRRIEEENR